ncbi:monovalent cation/H(+) antiporter subunit G [Sphingobium sp. HWE2-09]|uniref:monovalent cation/H(+) antiporter subunit G n=1 Tax=Sphingobium sp. HWE2-09 TaxID=3108390 RepID=UPI002DCF1847|nr:monovalent cation/H(+) antiporter subunit G [Sphingobium sp. HWE2-09]
MTIFAMLLMALGAAFLLVAAIGVIRLPDPLQRLHSAAKAGTMGTALMLVGAILSGKVDASAKGLLTLLFLLLTLPLGAQLLGRATYISGTALKGIKDDPLDQHLDRTKEPKTP